MIPFQVSPAAPHELLPACRLLFPDSAEERRDQLLVADADPSGLFVARDARGSLHAAALVQVTSRRAGCRVGAARAIPIGAVEAVDGAPRANGSVRAA